MITTFKECIICGEEIYSKSLCEHHYHERLNFIHGLKSWKNSFWYKKDDYAICLFDLYNGIKETLQQNQNIPDYFQDSLCNLLYSLSEILEKYPDGYSNHIIENTPYPNLEEKTQVFIYKFNRKQIEIKNEPHQVISEPQNSTPEFIDYRTKYPLIYRCSDGHFVRSKAEREIDNFLFNNDITHVYEYHYISLDGTEYFPDFYIPKYHLIIEYFGINKDNYLKTKNQKITTYKNDRRYNFEYLTPDQDNDFEFYLTKIFKKYQKDT